MKWLQTQWPLLRDVGITGTAFLIIWVELILFAVLGRVPDPLLTGFACSALLPSAYAHLRHILQSAGPSSESSPSPSAASSLSSSSPEAASGEH